MKHRIASLCRTILTLVHFSVLLELLRRIFKKINSLILQSNFKECHTSVVFNKVNCIAGGNYISIGKNSSFGIGLYLMAWTDKEKDISPSLEIGEFCTIGDYNHITCANRIIIGDGFLSGKWVTITDNSHGNTVIDEATIPPRSRQIQSKGSVIIGKNVWLGDKVTVLPNVTIGDGVIVGSNSVVTKNIPAFCVAAGNPAKIVKHLN